LVETGSVPKEEPGPFSAIDRRSRADEVRKQLQDAVEQGKFKPGDRLPSERELSDVFGVSRVSVRDAVRSLEALGMIEVRQGSGSFVAQSRADGFVAPFGRWIELHRDEILELLAVRSALDQLAAQRAADRAGRDEIRAVEVAHRRFVREATSASTPLAELSELDIAFHEAVARASQSNLILRLIVDLNRQLEESRRAVLASPERRLASTAQHEAILTAIKNGDPIGAREAVSAHVGAVVSFLETVRA
jgi:GntR family transcriptional repressor for pyruvate dehydrogenase complex